MDRRLMADLPTKEPPNTPLPVLIKPQDELLPLLATSAALVPEGVTSAGGRLDTRVGGLPAAGSRPFARAPAEGGSEVRESAGYTAVGSVPSLPPRLALC